MEACIAKDGCKGYISAGSRSLDGILSILPTWGTHRSGGVFFVCPFQLLCLHLQITPIFLQIVFFRFLVCFYSTKNCWVVGSGVQRQGGEGVLGTGTVGCCFIPTLFLYFHRGLGRLLAHQIDGVQRGHSRQEHWEGDDCRWPRANHSHSFLCPGCLRGSRVQGARLSRRIVHNHHHTYL